MGSVNLVEFRTALRTELSDGSTFFTDAEIDRGVVKAVAAMSRAMPKSAVTETTIDRKITGETITISSNSGTTANKPIEPGTVSITGETLDTDYTINYLTGVVTEKGGLLADDDYTIAYDKDWQLLDISSLITDFSRITHVEIETGLEPPVYVSFYIIGITFLGITGEDTFRNTKHIRIWTEGPWTPPAAATGGRIEIWGV